MGSFLIRVVVGAVVLFLVVELFGEVQDERDEPLHVWFFPQAWRRGDATT